MRDEFFHGCEDRICDPENGGSTVLRNVGIQPLHYTAQLPSKP